ncbi:MAG: cation diffusion facilitator family transporter [Herpetosiphon sp.]
MTHHHTHIPRSFGRAFVVGIALNLGFVVIEFWSGRAAHSLALVADAGHNLADVLALALAWGAGVLTARLPTVRRTYGLRRSSILAALVNAMVLLISSGAIAWEAVQRLGAPTPVVERTVILVALVGILINSVTAWLFSRGHAQDLNIRGAFLHMAADAVVSLGVVVAAGLMVVTGWFWLDPVVALLVVGFILLATWGLLRDSVNLALDAVPAGIEVAEVSAYLQSLPGVQDVHDMHIWGMSTTETALTVHLTVETDALPSSDQLIGAATQMLHDRFGIEHTTMQIEWCDAGRQCGCSLEGTGRREAQYHAA